MKCLGLYTGFQSSNSLHLLPKRRRGSYDAKEKQKPRLQCAQDTKDPKKIKTAIEKFLNACDILTRMPHFTGKKVFGATKPKLSLLPGSQYDSHRPDKINFLCPCVETRSAKAERIHEVVQEAKVEVEAEASMEIIADVKNIAIVDHEVNDDSIPLL